MSRSAAVVVLYLVSLQRHSHRWIMVVDLRSHPSRSSGSFTHSLIHSFTHPLTHSLTLIGSMIHLYYLLPLYTTHSCIGYWSLYGW